MSNNNSRTFISDVTTIVGADKLKHVLSSVARESLESGREKEIDISIIINPSEEKNTVNICCYTSVFHKGILEKSENNCIVNEEIEVDSSVDQLDIFY